MLFLKQNCKPIRMKRVGVLYRYGYMVSTMYVDLNFLFDEQV